MKMEKITWKKRNREQKSHLCNHVINEAVLIPDAKLLKLLPVAVLIHLLENLQKSAIVDLQDRVLCRQIQRPANKHQLPSTYNSGKAYPHVMLMLLHHLSRVQTASSRIII